MPLPPNIIWIVTTQWRAQACGYAGDANARTPCLDALAAESANYTQAVTPHPFGPFARAALLTGVPSPENGVGDYYDPLPPETRTVAHDLRERGYSTGFFGQWQLGQRARGVPVVGETHAKTVVPTAARGGFEFWEGFEGGFRLNDPFLHGTSWPDPTPFPGYQSDVLCDRAQKWIRRAGPWFCVVSLEPPHPPYHAPSSGALPRPPSEVILLPNVPPGGETAERARRELAGYYAHIEATDRAIGRLLSDINRNDTVVVFTSVHGDMHGAHGLFRKGWPFEECVRVPLLIREPGGVPRQDPSCVSLRQLRELARDWSDGKSTSVNASYAQISMPSVVAFPHQCDRVWRGVRSPTRKLVVEGNGVPWMFFDLEQDPWETRNLAHDPAYVREINDWRSRV
jgi:arylsulfatase A-like enzyme